LKPHFEHVTVLPGESWALQSKDFQRIPFLWHYHPEFELTLILNAEGHRYVGDSLQPFGQGDLALVGPNQAHSWASVRRIDPDRPIHAVVAWFTAEWLDAVMTTWPEMLMLRALRDGAARGLRFSPRHAADCVAPLLALHGMAPPQRLLGLLQVLTHLAQDRAVQPLASHAGVVDDARSRQRLSAVLARVHADLGNVPAAPLLAGQASLSTGAFHRWFKRHTGLTLLQYVQQLRIGQACQALIGSERAIHLIAAEAGFGTLAHFNRQFLRAKGMTPTRFRAAYRVG